LLLQVRHGQSEGNVDEAAYTCVPDPRIGLTSRGWEEAEASGCRIRELVSTGCDDWKVYFYVSPYQRTLETLRGLGKAFEPERIAGVREEPRIREQDFGEKKSYCIRVIIFFTDILFYCHCYCICILGNFQDREKMRVEKEARRRYGRFFYRFPNGESAADVYDRITGPSYAFLLKKIRFISRLDLTCLSIVIQFYLKFCFIPRLHLNCLFSQIILKE
jgi:bisphosphoglycerate-dependent phosphoglycerate mutase